MADDTDTEGKPLTGKDLTAAFDKLAATLGTVVQPPQRVEEPPKPEREYSRAELRQAVEEGKVTQDAADAIWDKQVEKRVTRTVADTVRAEQTAQTVGQQIDGYFAKYTELNDKSSALFGKVKAQFDDLVRNGSPATKATELAALRIAIPAADLGPGERQLEVSPETSGGGGAPPRRRGPEREDEPPSTLTARQKAHYQRGIDMGMYAGWKAVREELKYARPPIAGRRDAA